MQDPTPQHSVASSLYWNTHAGISFEFILYLCRMEIQIPDSDPNSISGPQKGPAERGHVKTSNPYQAPSKNPSKKALPLKNLLRTLLRSVRLHDPLKVCALSYNCSRIQRRGFAIMRAFVGYVDQFLHRRLLPFDR